MIFFKLNTFSENNSTFFSQLSFPIFLVKIAVYILDKISLSPLNNEQLDLFTKDNIVSNKYKNLRNLDIIPQDLKEKIKKIVKENS